MLQIKNLSKSYGAKKAVSNLSFVVEDGDIMGFIGKNGAGKTTTLKACLGIIGIDEGEILLDGTSVLKNRWLVSGRWRMCQIIPSLTSI